MKKPIHIGPDMKVVHPDYGDMTEDVARELCELNRQVAEKAYVEAQARQHAIARTCGTESAVRKDGLRLVAQIDEDVYNYWEAREGRKFWTHELDYMLKRHPELAVTPKRANPVFGYKGTAKPRIGGKRGRWAL